MWLDEIERITKNNRELLEDSISGPLEELDTERMARVLRELAGLIKSMENYPENITAQEFVVKYLSLSDDAKEVLG